MTTLTDILIKLDNACPLDELFLLGKRISQDISFAYGKLDRLAKDNPDFTAWQALISSNMARLAQINHRIGIYTEL